MSGVGVFVSLCWVFDGDAVTSAVCGFTVTAVDAGDNTVASCGKPWLFTEELATADASAAVLGVYPWVFVTGGFTAGDVDVDGPVVDGLTAVFFLSVGDAVDDVVSLSLEPGGEVLVCMR